MTKRLNNTNSYFFAVNNNNYVVTITRTKNNVYGNPRFKANIICLANNPNNYCYTAVYSFAGHYYDEQKEAQWILEYYLKNK